MKQEKKTIKKNELIPFHWSDALDIDSDTSLDNGLRYFYPDETANIRKKYLNLYYDIIDWCWENTDQVYKLTDKNKKQDHFDLSKLKISDHSIDENIQENLSERESSGFYKHIDKFQKNENEIIYCNAWNRGQLLLLISQQTSRNIRAYLKQLGWDRYSIICPEECPAFLRKVNNYDQIVVLLSLIEWNSFSDKTKDELINKFKEDGFEYYKKAELIKMRSINTKIHPLSAGVVPFTHITFPIDKKTECFAAECYLNYLQYLRQSNTSPLG